MMKKWLLFMLLLLPLAAWAEETDVDFLRGFVCGKYHVIGEKMESTEAYNGTVLVERDGKALKVTKKTAGHTWVGTGKIVLSRESVPQLKVTYKTKEGVVESTFLIDSDLDNYARLSGYIYIPGKRTTDPGLEALFIDHR